MYEKRKKKFLLNIFDTLVEYLKHKYSNSNSSNIIIIYSCLLIFTLPANFGISSKFDIVFKYSK